MRVISKNRPTANDVHIPGPMSSGRKRKPVQKPWTADNVPENLKEWPEPMRVRFAAVATQVLEETGDEEKAVQAGIAAAMRLKKMIEKANYAKSLCMLCKENPPDSDSLWQDSDGGLQRAWHCAKCFPAWYAEKGEMVIHTHKLEGGVAPGRYKPIRHSPKEKRKVSKDTVLKINGQPVTVEAMARAWVMAQPGAPTEALAPPDTIEKAWEVEIVKADEEKRLLYGVALEPQTKDSQNDIADEEEIEKAAHNFMIKSRLMDLQHKEVVDPKKAIPVESYIAMVDMMVNDKPIKKGSWVVVTKIFDDEIWQMVKSGAIKGYSIRGFGKRKPVA